jgi:hypothetical protein
MYVKYKLPKEEARKEKNYLDSTKEIRKNF